MSNFFPRFPNVVREHPGYSKNELFQQIAKNPELRDALVSEIESIAKLMLTTIKKRRQLESDVQAAKMGATTLLEKYDAETEVVSKYLEENQEYMEADVLNRVARSEEKVRDILNLLQKGQI